MRVQALVDREPARLRALEETLRAKYEEPARFAKKEVSLLHAEWIYEQSHVLL